MSDQRIREDAVRDAMLQMHVASTRTTAIASIGNATLVLTIYLYSGESFASVFGWWLIMVLTMLVRMRLARAWTHDPRRIERGPLWMRRFAVIVSFGGLLWGLTATALYPSAASGIRPLSALVLMGVSAAAVVSLASHRLAHRGFFLFMMGPAIIAFGLSHTRIEELTALALSLFTIILLISGRKVADGIEKTVRLQLELRASIEQATLAQHKAEAASAAKSEFLANMSHELRTPMHAILAYTRLGLENQNDERIKRYFSRILGGSERLLRLIDNLLLLSRTSDELAPLQREPVCIAVVLDAVLHEAFFNATAQRFHIDNATDNRPLMLDRAQIENLLRKLLENAVQYSPQAANIDISLSYAQRDQHPARLHLCIADRGIGIPEDEQEIIFERFVQSSRTRTGAGGTGLGLAICKEIVAAHGGHIHARNREGGGAEFIVELPLANGAQER